MAANKLFAAIKNDVDVIRMGFEPMTHSLEGCCSIQLSYPTILVCCIAVQR